MSATQTFPATHEITQKDLHFTETGYKYSDEAAVAIVMRDFDTCNQYVRQNDWPLWWTESDRLVQSPQNTSPWGSGVLSGETVPNFLLSNVLDAMVPKIVGGMTYDDPPFLLRPRPGTTGETVRAKTAIASYQLEDMNFKVALEEGVYDMGLRGTVFYEWGWHEEVKKYRNFKRKADPQTITSPVGYTTTIHTEDSDAIEFEMVVRQNRRPFLEKRDLARVFPDPACKHNDVRFAKWVEKASYVDWSDLEKLAQLPDYDIPPKQVLLDWFLKDKQTARGDNPVMSVPESMRAYLAHAVPTNYPTSADPLRASLLLIERQDENFIIAVLCHGADCILIRNSENPFAEISRMAGGTGHCFLSSVWRPLRDSTYGQGLGQIIGPRQMVAQGTETLALGVASYALNPTFTKLAGWNTPTQQINLNSGDVLNIDGDDVRKGIGLLEMPKVQSEVWQILNYTKAEALESAGANQQYTMGASAPGIQSTGQRSGSGAQQSGAAAAARADGPTERFIDQILIPFIYIMDNLNNELLPASDMRKILGDRDPEIVKEFDHVRYRQAQIQYEALAGAHLGPKREMIQFLAMVEQIAINPQLQEAAAQAGLKFNFVEWFKNFADLSGFKFSQEFFIPMSQDEIKRRDANSKAALQQQQQQGVSALQAQKDKAKESQIFDQGLARAGEKATVLQAEHALLLGQETLGSETPG